MYVCREMPFLSTFLKIMKITFRKASTFQCTFHDLPANVYWWNPPYRHSMKKVLKELVTSPFLAGGRGMGYVLLASAEESCRIVL